MTATEILALVFSQSITNFKRYKPFLGDMPKVINNLEGPLFIDLAAINGTVTKNCDLDGNFGTGLIAIGYLVHLIQTNVW